jgi:hypothetical protein
MEQTKFQRDIEADEWKRIGIQLLIGSVMAVAFWVLIGMIEAVARWIES